MGRFSLRRLRQAAKTKVRSTIFKWLLLAILKRIKKALSSRQQSEE